MSLGNSGSSAAHDAEEQRVKKRNKMILYIILFAIFQVAIIALFSLTVMKVRAPKFRVISAALADVSVGTPANSSFAAKLNVELSLKNVNFGRYEFEETAVAFLHGGAPAGQATVGASLANIRSTKRFEVVVDLSIAASPRLSSDLRAGVLALDSSAKMSGKVVLMFVMKKKRATSMSCSMDIAVATKSITNITCK